LDRSGIAELIDDVHRAKGVVLADAAPESSVGPCAHLNPARLLLKLDSADIWTAQSARASALRDAGSLFSGA